MASLNLNKVVLAGHLTANPELRQTPNGISVTSFSIAVNRRTAKTADGQNAQNSVDFINLVAWRNVADFITRYFESDGDMFLSLLNLPCVTIQCCSYFFVSLFC